MTPVFYTYLDELQAWLGRNITTSIPAGVPLTAPAPAGD
jgi:hypothetical protein